MFSLGDSKQLERPGKFIIIIIMLCKINNSILKSYLWPLQRFNKWSDVFLSLLAELHWCFKTLSFFFLKNKQKQNSSAVCAVRLPGCVVGYVSHRKPQVEPVKCGAELEVEETRPVDVVQPPEVQLDRKAITQLLTQKLTAQTFDKTLR